MVPPGTLRFELTFAVSITGRPKVVAVGAAERLVVLVNAATVRVSDPLPEVKKLSPE